MKRCFSLLIAGLLLTLMSAAQTPETLTNSAVVKMSKARLSEELIIDIINTSPVSFDLSDNALKSLEEEGITSTVIGAMKSAATAGAKTVTQPTAATTENTKKKVTVPVTEPVSPPEPVTGDPDADDVTGVSEPGMTITQDAFAYLAPVIDIIRAHEKEFSRLDMTIAEWDKQIRTRIGEVNKTKGQMLQVEFDLRRQKNTDTKSFGDEILSLKKKLNAYRGKYEQEKASMVTEGQTIAKKLETIKNDCIRSSGKAYGDAIQKVNSVKTDPAAGKSANPYTSTVNSISMARVDHIVFATEMLAWYRNDISRLNSLIAEWNPKVETVVREDENLARQLKPKEERMEAIKGDAKQYKAEIATLKKEISALEKERKKLADKMEDDAKAFAATLKQMSQENEAALKERFTDIIENITYSFSEKLSL